MHRCNGFLIAGAALVVCGWMILAGRTTGQADRPATQPLISDPSAARTGAHHRPGVRTS